MTMTRNLLLFQYSGLGMRRRWIARNQQGRVTALSIEDCPPDSFLLFHVKREARSTRAVSPAFSGTRPCSITP
jgi:hypothetical protein